MSQNDYVISSFIRRRHDSRDCRHRPSLIICSIRVLFKICTIELFPSQSIHERFSGETTTFPKGALTCSTTSPRYRGATTYRKTKKLSVIFIEFSVSEHEDADHRESKSRNPLKKLHRLRSVVQAMSVYTGSIFTDVRGIERNHALLHTRTDPSGRRKHFHKLWESPICDSSYSIIEWVQAS